MLWKCSSFEVRSEKYPANKNKIEVAYTSQHSDDEPYNKSTVKLPKYKEMNN